jgi:hypothetical protein
LSARIALLGLACQQRFGFASLSASRLGAGRQARLPTFPKQRLLRAEGLGRSGIWLTARAEGSKRADERQPSGWSVLTSRPQGGVLTSGGEAEAC